MSNKPEEDCEQGSKMSKHLKEPAVSSPKEENRAEMQRSKPISKTGKGSTSGTGIVKQRMKDLWRDFLVKEFIPVKLLNFLLYGGMMSLFPFLTLQARSLGITESELGIIYGFIPITALFGPPLAGMLADKIGNFKYFLGITVAASGFAALLFMVIPIGRIHHPLPELLHLTLTCNTLGTDESSQHLHMPDKFDCGQKSFENQLMIVTSCEHICSEDPPIMSMNDSVVESKIFLERILGAYNNSEADLLDVFNSSLHTSQTKFYDVFKTIEVSSKNDTFQINSEVCKTLPENIFSGSGNNSTAPCPVRCKVLTPSPVVCSDSVVVEELNPSLTFWLYVFVRTLNSVTLATSMPLFEGAVVSILKQYDGDFGFQRLFGSLGPILITPLSGHLIDSFSAATNTQDYRPAFYLYFTMKMLCTVVILFMDLNFKLPSTRVVKNLRDLITNPEIFIFLIMTFLAGTCFGIMDTFLFWLLQDIGASKKLMGLTLTVGNLCGIPILIFATPLIEKLGAVNTIILGFVFYVVRFVGYSLMYNPWLCMPFEALECFTFALLITASISYAAELSTISTTATLQGVMGGLHHGMGRGVGSFIGGFAIAAIGVRVTFQMMAGVALVTSLTYFFINRTFFREAALERKRRREKEQQDKCENKIEGSKGSQVNDEMKQVVNNDDNREANENTDRVEISNDNVQFDNVGFIDDEGNKSHLEDSSKL